MISHVGLLERSQSWLSEGFQESVVIVYLYPRDVYTHLGVSLIIELDAVSQETQGQHQSATQDHVKHTCNNIRINKI